MTRKRPRHPHKGTRPPGAGVGLGFGLPSLETGWAFQGLSTHSSSSGRAGLCSRLRVERRLRWRMGMHARREGGREREGEQVGEGLGQPLSRPAGPLVVNVKPGTQDARLAAASTCSSALICGRVRQLDSGTTPSSPRLGIPRPSYTPLRIDALLLYGGRGGGGASEPR